MHIWYVSWNNSTMLDLIAEMCGTSAIWMSKMWFLVYWEGNIKSEFKHSGQISSVVLSFLSQFDERHNNDTNISIFLSGQLLTAPIGQLQCPQR